MPLFYMSVSVSDGLKKNVVKQVQSKCCRQACHRIVLIQGSPLYVDSIYT